MGNVLRGFRESSSVVLYEQQVANLCNMMSSVLDRIIGEYIIS